MVNYKYLNFVIGRVVAVSLYGKNLSGIMRSKYIFAFIVFVLLCVGNSIAAFASHIYGGELLYKHISGNTYRVTLTLYGDCSSTVSASLPTSVPKIYIYNNNLFFDSLSLNLDAPGLEVSPVCPKLISSTACNGGNLPGVKKFTYSNTVVLSTPSTNWRFIFSGELRVSVAGRSNNITNVLNSGSTVMQLQAALNNATSPNSSPNYTTIPTPFYCLLEDQQYNQGAIDSDGDSLSFSLVSAVNASPANPLYSPSVNYASPFSGAFPLGTIPGQFTFSVLNGQLTFTPSGVQNALIVNQVSEYRNGVLIGTSQREMTFIVADNCEGTPPALTVANVVGGAITGKNIINICVGTSLLTFDVNLSNPDRDTTEITPKNVPLGANISVVNNYSPSPSVRFSWNTDTLTTGIYTFFLDVKNDHCPIANRQTVAYTINVTPFPTVAATQISPTQCVHNAAIRYNLALGYLPRTLTVVQGGTTIKTFLDSTGTITDSLPAGDYTIIASSHPTCQVSTPLTITDGGVLPLSPVTVTYCKGDPKLPIPVTKRAPESEIFWYDAANNLLGAAPFPGTETAGTSTWYIQERYKVCTSDKVPVTVIVNPLPQTVIVNNPNTICLGDTIYLQASGGIEYTWSPTDRILADKEGRLFTRLMSPGTFSVRTVNEFGCVDSTKITYTKIEPCCQYSYPNAFTPNGDGKNDGFKVITYGNSWSYKLAIYNRWGQLVFLSYDPAKYWDGTQYGRPCDAGTYFYFFSGRCVTGGTDEHQGDVTLIR